MPPTTDEIEAAAGRLRRLAAGEWASAVYPKDDGRQHADPEVIVAAWLAATAHDPLPITAAWLKSALPAPPAGRDWAECVGPVGNVVWMPGAVPNPGCLPVWVNARAVLSPATRGECRRLLAALGVPLPNPTNPTPTE